MDKSLTPKYVKIVFDEIPDDRGAYVITVEQVRRDPAGRRYQNDTYAFRCPSRRGPDWNGDRIAAFLDMLVSQFPADAALLDFVAGGGLDGTLNA